MLPDRALAIAVQYLLDEETMFAYEPAAEYGVFLQAFVPGKWVTFEYDDQPKRIPHRPPPASTHFESVEAANSANVYFWAHRWGVTVLQIKIAAGRVGARPEDVFEEIAGKRKTA
jgi:hypothetical protein